ncbi:hypothetical protein M9458_023630, partial [Cirrhinus mrigala]
MTLNTQKEGKEPLRRRASTPIPSSRQTGRGERDPSADPYHPPLAQSASYHPGDKSIHSRANWSSDSDVFIALFCWGITAWGSQALPTFLLEYKRRMRTNTLE